MERDPLTRSEWEEQLTEKKSGTAMKDLDIEVRHMLGGGETGSTETDNPLREQSEDEEEERADKEDEE
jgi:hypothetical protein